VKIESKKKVKIILIKEQYIRSTLNYLYGRKNNMRILILIQLLAGFVLAFLGVIIMFHLGEVWLGLSISLVGFYAVIRATHRSSYDLGEKDGYIDGYWEGSRDEITDPKKKKNYKI
tara:strand:+ start:1914 stop:2261 length:348 start_codon:yes stop_codon:yes gene_type:complete